jgi:hypothetical protein
LVVDWLPALDAVVEKLEAGAKVADVGCGHGASTLTFVENSTVSLVERLHEGILRFTYLLKELVL